MKFVNLAILFIFISLTSLAQTKDEPVINLNFDTIPFNEVAIGTWYDLDYVVSAENLIEDLIITVPMVAGQGFRIREYGETSWAYSIILNQSNGTVPETTIEILCAPIDEIFYSTIISHTSGVAMADLPVSGTGIPLGENFVMVHPFEINFGNVAVGSDSLAPFFYHFVNESISWKLLTYPSGQGFTDEDGAPWIQTNATARACFALFTPEAVGYFEGDFTVESASGLIGYVHLTGYGVIPSISLNAESHDFGEVEVGDYSPEFIYEIIGTTLVSDITITAPYSFEISLTSGTGFTGQIILQAIDGNVEDTQIFVRFAPQITTPYSGNIIHETDYGETQTITLFGTGVVGTSINNISENNFNIYPNPSNGIINLTGFHSARAGLLGFVGIEITDITGKTICNTRGHVPLAAPLQIDLSGLRKGVYFINIFTSKNNYTEKLIIH